MSLHFEVFADDFTESVDAWDCRMNFFEHEQLLWIRSTVLFARLQQAYSNTISVTRRKDWTVDLVVSKLSQLSLIKYIVE